MAKQIRLSNVLGCKVGLHDVTETPFVLSGLPWFKQERRFCRLPVDAIDKMDKIREGAWAMAGAMVRFRTNSDIIAVKVKLRSGGDMSHMPRTGISGVDLYVGTGTQKRFAGIAQPGAGKDRYADVLARLPDSSMREWTLNLPLYNGIERLQIGLAPQSRVLRPAPFSVPKPILFYGSSITQGGCASRPGNAFSHIICRWLDANLINLGFSGCGMLEPVMAELIASLKMSVLVIDSSNARTELKRERHEPFFRIIRDRQPHLPIVFGTRADYQRPRENQRLRRAIVRRTYNRARERGDRRVFFVEGTRIFGPRYYDACTVDGGHPNDLGFMRMAEAYDPVIRRALRSCRA